MVNLFKKAKMLAASAVLLMSIAATGATTLINAQSASAATSADCNLNIVCNGLSGSTDSAYINSFKSLYTKGTDGHYNDLKAVYNWMGASTSIVNGMNTTNTEIGTVYKDGHITVGGKTVATDATITARFTKGAGFTKVEGNVYARKTTTYEYYATNQAIVYMQNGKMVFFVETSCGNAGKGTPVVTPPTPPQPPVTPPAALTCDMLSFKQTAGTDEYTFSAAATPTNTTITNYNFSFGDKAVQNVATSAKTASATHTYAGPGNYTAFVSVSSKDKTNITSPKCAVLITIAQPMCTIPGKTNLPANSPDCVETPVMTCDALTISQDSTNLHEYTFTIQGTGTHATITGYTVDFGDSSTPYTGTQPSVQHTYSQTGPMTITASITFLANGKSTTVSDKTNCVKQITVPVMCTVPGKEQYPATDTTNCVTPPVVPPVTPPVTPTVLPNTGAGNVIGLFTGFTIAGAAFHRLISSRRLFSLGR